MTCWWCKGECGGVCPEYSEIRQSVVVDGLLGPVTNQHTLEQPLVAPGYFMEGNE